jgi:hypothetical protein
MPETGSRHDDNIVAAHLAHRRLLSYAYLGANLASSCEMCGAANGNTHETADGMEAATVCAQCVSTLRAARGPRRLTTTTPGAGTGSPTGNDTPTHKENQ